MCVCECGVCVWMGVWMRGKGVLTWSFRIIAGNRLFYETMDDDLGGLDVSLSLVLSFPLSLSFSFFFVISLPFFPSAHTLSTPSLSPLITSLFLNGLVTSFSLSFSPLFLLSPGLSHSLSTPAPKYSSILIQGVCQRRLQ